MKSYLTKEHIELLRENLRYFPKYENFDLTEISKLIAENNDSYKDWSYIFSKISAVHSDIFRELLFNGFIEIVDKEKGICKFTSDGHKLKDIGDYEKYLEYLNLDYASRKQENILKKYWWLWTSISFVVGILVDNFLCIIKFLADFFK